MFVIFIIFIWAIIALFYSKNKNERYLISFIKLPFILFWILIKVFVSDMASSNGSLSKYKNQDLAKKAKEQGYSQEKIDEAIAKREDLHENAKVWESWMEDFEIKRKEDKKH